MANSGELLLQQKFNTVTTIRYKASLPLIFYANKTAWFFTTEFYGNKRQQDWYNILYFIPLMDFSLHEKKYIINNNEITKVHVPVLHTKPFIYM